MNYSPLCVKMSAIIEGQRCVCANGLPPGTAVFRMDVYGFAHGAVRKDLLKDPSDVCVYIHDM